MNNKKLDVEEVWKQVDDAVVPQLGLSVTDRATYSYLLRHSRLEGKRQIRFSIPWLGRGIRLSGGAARAAVRRLAGYGLVRVVRRSKAGHLTEIRLPDEAGATCRAEKAERKAAPMVDLEKADAMKSRELRKAIHAREGGFCFYCLRRMEEKVRCLDHVVPSCRSGPNSYRNLVSCCLECNSEKGEKAVADFLRGLYREGRLTAVEFRRRVKALEALASGKLRPIVTPPSSPRFRGKAV